MVLIYTLQHISLLQVHGVLSTALLRRVEKCSLFEAQRILKSIIEDYENVHWDGPFKITMIEVADEVAPEAKKHRVWKNVYKP
jgi:hypothetical protein